MAHEISIQSFGDLKAQVGDTTLASATVGSLDAEYKISCFITVLHSGSGMAGQVLIDYTDEFSNAKTITTTLSSNIGVRIQTLTVGLIGPYNVICTNIRCLGGTSITVYTSGFQSFDYNSSATIEYVRKL